MQQKVLVTGGSGFIGKHLIRELLEHGFAVRSSYRSELRREELVALFGDDIEFAKIDLLQDEGWDAALAGIQVLIHTASPFPLGSPKDPQELIVPAVQGTLRALQAAERAGVKQVILTSSCAAIYKSPTKQRQVRSTSQDWTDPDGTATTAYEASKTLAERAAWDFVEQHPGMSLTVVNPGWVAGPPLDEHYGTSLQQFESYLAGEVPLNPKINLPIVDVRDVARIHVGAIAVPAAAGQRFPATVPAIDMVQIAEVLQAAYPERKISTRLAPNWLVRALSLFSPLMKTVASNIGRNLDVDGSAAETTFGFSYISAEDAILASAQYLTGHGK